LPAPVKSCKGGSLIYVYVMPSSKVTRIEGVENGRLVIKVSSPPVKGKANAELLKTLKKALKARVSIISGETSKEKVVKVDGLTPSEVLERLGLKD
jgi:uncharacterized protein (TIGR00251 family)